MVINKKMSNIYSLKRHYKEIEKSITQENDGKIYRQIDRQIDMKI